MVRTMSADPSWRRAGLLWLPVVGWAALIFLLSAQSDLRFSSDAGIDWPLRKVAHLMIFAILAILTARALTGTRIRHATLFSFVLAGFYAISDEVHQSFVAGRSPLLTDVLIDLVGVAVGLLIWQRFLSSRVFGASRD
jgi:VanZ family protein